MARSPDTKQLRAIVTVRNLQRLRAEAEVGRASALLSSRLDALLVSEQERDSAEEAWRATLAAPSLLLERASLWSRALLRQETVVEDARREHTASKNALRRRAADWHLAVTRSDSATDAVRTARRKNTERRDENALQDVLDRFGERGGRR
jgi:hypothetical protein